ncbi:hypothetical protein Nepgr_021157 [Nepenthes gracilis]|uniref:Uncharacterized protein n=1 Tax=Nepenthes gracilis TaxID=150966 RepID=A0AAD3SYK9_NEPGR|nr:hypothetical protein Nepgr_021157 [Nepenthes gracilis]
MAPVSGDGASHQTSSMEPKRMLKRKKSQKIATKAMIRGFEKYIEVEESTPDTKHYHNEAAWHTVPHLEERLQFWSDPNTELKLAKNTGDSVFRMGVDWSKIMPKEPMDRLKETVNVAALELYKWIIYRVRSFGMKVMMTLFPHSLPPWAGVYGGWKLERTVGYFMDFTKMIVNSVSDVVDYRVTFNSSPVFCLLTYCASAWPGGHPDALETIWQEQLLILWRSFLKLTTDLHSLAKPPVSVSIAIKTHEIEPRIFIFLLRTTARSSSSVPSILLSGKLLAIAVAPRLEPLLYRHECGLGSDNLEELTWDELASWCLIFFKTRGKSLHFLRTARLTPILFMYV